MSLVKKAIGSVAQVRIQKQFLKCFSLLLAVAATMMVVPTLVDSTELIGVQGLKVTALTLSTLSTHLSA
jgi:hypothetical protein